MIERGLRLRDLGSDHFRWSDLRAIVSHLPAGSALIRTKEPEHWRWGVTEHLLASIADSLRWLVWAKTKDGQKGRRRPKLIPRPGEQKQDQGRFKGVVSRSIADVKRLLARPRK